MTDADIKNLEMFCRANLNVSSMQLKAQTLLGYQVVNKCIEEAFLNPSENLVAGIINSISNVNHAKFLQDLNSTFLFTAISQFYLEHHSTTVAKPKKTVTKTIIVEEIQEDIEAPMSLSLKEECILQVESILSDISYLKNEDPKYCSFFKEGSDVAICSLLFKNNGNIVLVVPEGNYNKQYPINNITELMELSRLIIA